jgi:hypothetical protein
MYSTVHCTVNKGSNFSSHHTEMPYYTKPLTRTSYPLLSFYFFYLPLHMFIVFPPIYYIPLFLLLYFVNTFPNITMCTSQQPSSHYITFLHFLPYLDILKFLPHPRHLVYSQYIHHIPLFLLLLISFHSFCSPDILGFLPFPANTFTNLPSTFHF